MRDKKFIAHSSPTTIRSKVFEFYQEAKAAVTDELKQGISKGLRFAVSFDEWTGKNRRYLTLNVHTKDADFYNLGMVRVWVSQTAETILKLVTRRLQEFGVELHHITAFVTDGASIMMKLGRIAPCEHIVCLSHTLYLVITDVFYKKKTADDSDSEETEDQEQQDDDDEEEVDDNDASIPSLEEPLGLREAIPELAGDIEPVIKKVRKIVSTFQVATTFLCKRTSTLAQAEDIIRFVCTKLEDMNTELSLKLVERLKIRYFKRRNTQMVSMSKFFENPSCFSPSTNDEFKMPTIAMITRTTKALHGRLYPEEVTADEPEASTGTQ